MHSFSARFRYSIHLMSKLSEELFMLDLPYLTDLNLNGEEIGYS